MDHSMDDDIDIEEHDLLDNPAIKNMFPDLSILKKEISGFFEEASSIKKEPDINEQLIAKNQNFDIDSDSKSNDSNTEKIKVGQNVTENSEKTQKPLVGNKIILGSKPTHPTKIKSNDRNHQDLSAAKVYLKDIGSYLARSERFCKICLTIFPHKMDFEIHKTTVHEQNTTENMVEKGNRITIGSIKKSYKCNQCSESFLEHSLLRRHLINVHKKMFKKSLIDTNHTTLQVSSPLRMRLVRSTKLNQCFHCKVSFSSKKLLIEHIYMVLQSKTDSDTKPSKSEELHKNQMKSTLRLPKMIAKKTNRQVGSNRRNKTSNGNLKGRNVPIKRTKTESFQRNVKKMQNNISVYQCVYCSYIFSDVNFCLKHIVNKHKDSSITEVKAVKFDEQCKYCPKKNYNWKLHNIHMQQYHKQKIDRTIKVFPKLCLPKVDNIMLKKQVSEQTSLMDNHFDDSTEKEIEMEFSEPEDIEKHNEEGESNSVNNDQLLLKSILFKCKRCDIHFLSAKSAMNHADHMELLINWKCLSCNKIFKKVDEKLHTKQHSFCNKFTVFELTESQLARTLYKCSKCTIHFDASGYLPHFKKCEIAVAESVYCKVCDILIDKRISVSHKTYHDNNKNLQPNDFTIINAAAIGAEPIHETVVDPPKKKISRKTYGLRLCFKLSYCKTCNSFVSKLGRNRKVHIESRCAHLPTYICHWCGLIFTNKAMATHKAMHQERKGIRLKDFSFYNGYGKQILPPVPEYPKCKSCHVHFISKVAVINHLCGEDFLTCHICNIKLSEPVFKLHMSFHYYSKPSKNLSQADKLHLTESSETRNEKRPPRPPPRKREIPTPGPSTNSAEFRQPELNQTLNKELPEKCESNELEIVNVDNPNIESAKLVPEAVTDECSLISSKSTNHKAYKTNQEDRKSDFTLFNVLYCCMNCRTTIDTYDAVVEHCQEHLCGGEIKNIRCETCKLKLDPKTFDNHKEFHAVNATNKSFEVLEFDTFYFALDNSIWIKHMFQNVEDEKTRLILDRSIYKYGGKMKMKVIQEGSSDLTVYKCNSCFVIVDPDFLIKHVENSCFKTRKHPCSYCGLPFMSYMSLKKHVSIHKKMNISFKSYRIVIINQEKDKNCNRVLNGPNKYFLFYKCRKCNGVFDTYQRQNHTLCNEKDLKNCSVCDLLFYSADYKAHMQKHELVCKFVPKNMKIILFGQSPTNKFDENLTNQTTFDGTIVDFTFIQCVKCGVCLEKSPLATINHHTCYEDSVLSKCSKCELYILKSKFARHSKLHDINVHFVKCNMNIIPYDHSEQLSKFVPANLNQVNNHEPDIPKTGREDKNLCNNMDDLNQTVNSTSYTADKSLRISEKTAKLYKCSCGLHFMDKTSIDEHFDHCDTEKSKQHCSKCNLLFTPNVLFNHLLLHHGDKKYIYTFNIKEMSKKKNCIVTLYNCVNCKTHFMEYDTAKIHFENCKGFEADRKECGACKLFFSSCSITQHETLHHDEKVADVEIVEVTAKNDNSDQIEKVSTSIDNVLEQADFVRESKYNLSDENLSQIDLGRYSNTIFKCEKCNTHFLTQHTYKRHVANGKHVLPPQKTCNFCELRFSLQSLTKHIYIHHKEMKLNNNDFIIKSNL